MPKTYRLTVTAEVFAKLTAFAKRSGFDLAKALDRALDAQLADAPDDLENEGEEGEGEEPALGEIGADDEDSILPGMKTVTDDPGEERAKKALAARRANFAAAMNAVGAEPGNPKKAVAAAADSVEKASDDLPPARKGGKANPLSTLKRWAQSDGARNATEPRPQRRG